MLRMTWTDPRTGQEYRIVCSDRLDQDGQWLGSHFRVRNLQTREEASLQYESLEFLQEALMELVDRAEGLIRQRSKRRWTASLWRTGRGVIGTVVSRARRRPAGEGEGE
jgi:hypothetical protein